MGRHQFIEYLGSNSEQQITASLNRYLNYRLRFKNYIKLEKIILLVDITHRWDTALFLNEIKDIKYNHIRGILFYTLEEFPRGDALHSPLNRSRMIRESLENSFPAVTANYKDLYIKLSSLLHLILKNLKEEKLVTLEKVRGELKKLYLKLSTEIEALSSNYHYGGVHTNDGHKIFRKAIDTVRKTGRKKFSKIDNTPFWDIIERSDTFDQAAIFANNPYQYNCDDNAFDILLIDDNPKSVKKDIAKLKDYFPSQTRLFITRQNEFQKWLSEKDSEFWNDMYDQKATLVLKNFFSMERKVFKKQELFTKGKGEQKTMFRFTFIIVDLLLGDYNEGNKIINNLERFRLIFNRLNPGSRTYFDIIALSLSEEAPDIHRALNEGSLVYVPKKRIFMLPAVIAQLEKSRRILADRAHNMTPLLKARNFLKLYKLPEMIMRQLENEPFFERAEPATGNLLKFLEEPALQWIRKMPKADIHCHLGGSMRGEIAFPLSLNMLVPSNLFDEEYKKTLAYLMKTICEFIKVILFGEIKRIKFLFTTFRVLLKIIIKFDLGRLNFDVIKKADKARIFGEIKKFLRYDKLLQDEKKVIDIYDRIIEAFTTECAYFIYTVAFCQDYLSHSSIREKTFDKVVTEVEFFKILQHYTKVHSIDVDSFQMVNIFNVLICLIEDKEEYEINWFWNKLSSLIELNPKNNESKKEEPKIEDVEEIGPKLVKDINLIESDRVEANKELFNFLKKDEDIQRLIDGHTEAGILGHYISAKKRGSKSLASYLGGCEFTGAEQLKKRENIIAALYDIIERNIDDNVRLLELKLSPDGYVSDDMTLQEAIHIILSATDLITLHFYSLGQFIRVNYIFTVKRHKPLREASQEISAAIVNRERDSFYQRVKPMVTKKNVGALKYAWKPARVMGVDLAGLEKGNPARNFLNDFSPLFKTSFFLTIHAGEEDTAKSIWEAVYILHANRIGHGLTLNEDMQLKELFKNLQICIEMNPISNMLTNSNIDKRYPFYDFIQDGLKITINTDNPAVSDSTLSEEFVTAARLFHTNKKNKEQFWISKWGILKILKNGFSSAFMDREEKRQLMRAVEEEIYQKIIDEYGVT